MKTTPLLAVLAVLAVSACATPEQQLARMDRNGARWIAAVYPEAGKASWNTQQGRVRECRKEVIEDPDVDLADDSIVAKAAIECYRRHGWIE